MSVTSWRIHHHELRRRALKVVVALPCCWNFNPGNRSIAAVLDHRERVRPWLQLERCIDTEVQELTVWKRAARPGDRANTLGVLRAVQGVRRRNHLRGGGPSRDQRRLRANYPVRELHLYRGDCGVAAAVRQAHVNDRAAIRWDLGAIWHRGVGCHWQHRNKEQRDRCRDARERANVLLHNFSLLRNDSPPCEAA